MKLIGARAGGGFDLRAALAALGGVIKARVHAQFLDHLGRRGRQPLTDGVVHRAAGLRVAARQSAGAGIERKPVGRHLAGGLAVEQVVGIGSVDGKAVARIALAVGPDGLISEAGVRSRAVQEVRTQTGAEDRQLREAARAQRHVVDGAGIQHVPRGGVHLVEQRSGSHFDGGRHRADFQLPVDRGGPVAFDQNGCVAFGLKTFFAEADAVVSDGQIRSLIRSVACGGEFDLQIGVYVLDSHGGAGNRRTGSIHYRADNAA